MLSGNQVDMIQVKWYLFHVWETFVFPKGYDMSQMTLLVYTKSAAHAGWEE